MKVAITSILMLITFSNIISQEATASDEAEQAPIISVSGSVDVYYRANLNADYDFAPATSFANLPGFSLGMANVILEHEGKKAGITADLVFGPRGEDATFLSPELRPGGISNIVNQLYAYWNISSSVKATIGNFNTFLGYEVISPTGNFNYSTSYMFSYGPFSHTGLKVDFDLGEGFSLMTGIFNPTDATEYNPSNNYAAGLQLGYENGGLGMWANALISDEFYQLDLTAGYDVTETVYVGLNATTAKDAFYGVATYVQVATSDKLKLGTRIEYFKDNGVDIEMLISGNSVVNTTLSAQYTVGNLVLIPEVRLDIFSNDDVVPNGEELGNSLSSLVVAAIYGF